MDFRQGLGYPSPMPGWSLRIPVAAVGARLGTLVAFALAFAAADAVAQGFSFSQPDTSAQREQQAREQRVAELLSTPCRAGLWLNLSGILVIFVLTYAVIVPILGAGR